jgi:hypothetical protein
LLKGVGVDRCADEFFLEEVARVRVGGLELPQPVPPAL